MESDGTTERMGLAWRASVADANAGERLLREVLRDIERIREADERDIWLS